jgi:fructokinase
MTHMITSMGEILVDFLPMASERKTAGFSMHAGGSPFNVAMGVARLGLPVAFAGKLSTDLFGRFLLARVQAEGVDTRFLLTSEAQSTLAFVAKENNEPVYAFYCEGTADTLLTPDEIPAALFEETGILHFGSISLLLGTTPAAVVSTVERLKGRALLSFDPNVRPGLVRDEVAYRALLDRVFALADVVKISAADLDWLLPGLDVEEASARLLAFGPALVVVTRGDKGVLARREGQIWEVPALDEQVVDTVGAGDAFSSGMLAGLAERGVVSRSALEHLQPEEFVQVLRLGAVVSGLTCTRAGADPPTRAEVSSFTGDAPGRYFSPGE